MYKFDPRGESVAADFRAIALSQIDAALAAGQATEPARRTALLEARRRTKKLRGLLRLVRPGFADFETENAALRDAAAALSGLRDREVLAQTLAALNLTHPDPVLTRIATRFPAEQTPATAPEPLLAAFRDALHDVHERAKHWDLAEDDVATLFAGLRQTYRKCRRGMRRADRIRTDFELHEWRKALKTHVFQLSLMREAAPDILAARRQLVDRVGDLLGSHHDLINLKAVLARDPDRFGDDADRQRLAEIVTQRLGELEAAAFALGRQVLDEKPRAFAKRIHSYWHAVKAVAS